MECPNCGGSSKGVAPNQYTLHCRNCGGAIKVDLINPAELLDLVEKAIKYQDSGPRWGTGCFYMKKLANPLIIYLKTGDPSALKKLGGVNDDPLE